METINLYTWILCTKLGMVCNKLYLPELYDTFLKFIKTCPAVMSYFFILKFKDLKRRKRSHNSEHFLWRIRV